MSFQEFTVLDICSDFVNFLLDERQSLAFVLSETAVTVVVYHEALLLLYFSGFTQ